MKNEIIEFHDTPPVGINAKEVSVKKFKKDGFKFEFYDYRAICIFPDGSRLAQPCMVIQDIAFVMNNTGKKALIFEIADNPHLKFEKIEGQEK